MELTACGVVIALCMSLALMPVSASDFTLEIFGNANMDDTIDDLDIKYVQGILDGTNDETDLADANYDGKIDEEDIAQIELLIDGNEKELTIVDSADRIVTIDKPVKRVASVNAVYWVARPLNAEDRIVGIPSYLMDEYPSYPLSLTPELKKIAVVGDPAEPDHEKIIETNPDVLIMFPYHPYQGFPDETQEKLASVGIKVIALGFTDADIFYKEVATLGYVLDTEERAEEYINFFRSWTDRIDEVVNDLEPEEKKTVFFEDKSKYSSYGQGSTMSDMIHVAGGINIYADVQGSSITVDPEYVMEQNPNVIFKGTNTGMRGYTLTNTSEYETIRDELMSRPELSDVAAVKNGDVYVINWGVYAGWSRVIGPVFMAKCLYPDKFKDLEPHDLLRTIQEDWMRIPYQGVYIYPYSP